jgi:hypothetical protein
VWVIVPKPRHHFLAVSAVAVNDEEPMAAVVHLISSGQVWFCAEALTAMMDVWATADAAA